MAKYKVAVATNDGVHVNVHFGHAAAFDVYEVDDESGEISKVEVRLKPEHCDGTCGSRETEGSSMDSAAKSLADLDYVLCEQVGTHAIRALARYNVRAFDIELPIAEAIAKINEFRKKIAERQKFLNSLKKG
ncbi:MAG: dinitrogenase iron-molybdenum cofactor biosynthesis protein [Fibrobacter sp.]|nr:dinitrogenase iron-molybdenum cofactor biosynthesis protein [Fibrobacter sp.]